MKMPRKFYTDDELKKIAKLLSEKPPIETAQGRSKQAAVALLKKEIVALQKRGYTFEQIARFITEGGCEITSPTLKSYLQRTKTLSKKSAIEKQCQAAEEATA